MTRWKTVPLYNGFFAVCRVCGSVHSRVPSARPTKLATVFGVSASNSRAVKFPSLVVKCASVIGPHAVRLWALGFGLSALGSRLWALGFGLSAASKVHSPEPGAEQEPSDPTCDLTAIFTSPG